MNNGSGLELILNGKDDDSGTQRLQLDDSLAERSKAPDSSSGGEIRVGSNPTAVSLFAVRLGVWIISSTDAKHPRPDSNRQSLD